jgi:hypothetical protein
VLERLLCGLETREAPSSEVDDDINGTFARPAGQLMLHSVDVGRHSRGGVIAAEDDRELIVPDSSADVLREGCPIEDFGNVAEQVIAGRVAVAIVGHHEPMDLGENEHVAVLRLVRVRAMGFEQVQKPPAIEQTRHGVGPGFCTESLGVLDEPFTAHLEMADRG